LYSGVWRGYGSFLAQTDGVMDNRKSMQKEESKLIKFRRSLEDFCVFEFLKILGENVMI
jgi:hypothetical protein